MRYTISILSLLLLVGNVRAQSTATDFTAAACSPDQGTFNLFTELNNGRIIVMAWVMPCFGCIDGAVAADSAVKALNLSVPGKASLWIVDDGPPSDCSSLSTWVTAQHLNKPILFGNYNNEVDQNNYGGFGMPHIVVIGPDKHIYFNERNGQGVGIYPAVLNALNGNTGITDRSGEMPFSVSVDQANSIIKLNSIRPVSNLTVYSQGGQVVKEEFYSRGRINPELSTAALSAGLYLVRITDIDGKTGVHKLVK